MACIVLKDAEGNTRRIPENTMFQRKPDEKIVGVDHDCSTSSSQTVTGSYRKLEQELSTGLGDMVAKFAKPIAKLVGKSNCSRCEARRLVLNAYGKLKAKHGMAKAIQIMNSIPTTNVDEAAKELREHLKD